MTLAMLIKESMKDKEAWHYTSLLPYTGFAVVAPTSNQDIALPPALTTHRLVFIDGALSSDLSTIDGLPEGFVSMESPSTHYVMTLGGQACLALDPIELLFINSENEEANEASTQLDITLGENSRLTLIERHVGKGAQLQARHHRTNIILAPQSKLLHGKVVHGHDNTLHVAQTNVSISDGAFYDHFGLVVGGKLVRCEKDISLIGKLAEARLVGGMMLRSQEHGDMTSVVRHMVPHCSSHQICKTVLADRARGIFQGKVYVEKDAQKTDAYQLCRSLLLSRQAEMDAKPELEIYADDVKCSHGTAIGDLDEHALFYLLSRGIDKKTARSMLIEAFIAELVDGIQSADIAGCVKAEVDQWLLT